jgi:pyruvate/2-oxoglutarate dehydrogenase complex dihydrolipoamide dehydrogenase (E3) component
MTPERFDAIVIGTGQAGGPLAGAFAKAGHKVAVVEKSFVGGSCINEGCTPTKTLIASARVAHLARRSSDYGVEVGSVGVDFAKAMARQREVVESFRQGSRSSLEGHDNVELIFGAARFVAEKRVQVRGKNGERLLAADKVFINVGTRPTVPPLSGLDEVPYLTNRSALALTELPEKLLVLGGGYIGVEFAQLFARLGSEVTLIQRGSQLLPREDADIAEALTEILREEEIEVLLDAEASSVEKRGDGVALSLTGREEPLVGTHLLLAVGRTSNADTLELDQAGVEVDDKGYVKVDERLEANVPGIYALGDVKGGPAFTHISYDDYRIVKDNLLHGEARTIEGRLVPYTVFTDPQLGRIGLTEREAREAGYEINVAKLEMRKVARAIETGETRGLMKAVIDAKTEKILGAAILGIEGGEVASVVQVAMMGDLPYTALRDSPFSHPTLAESLNNLFTRVE